MGRGRSRLGRWKRGLVKLEKIRISVMNEREGLPGFAHSLRRIELQVDVGDGRSSLRSVPTFRREPRDRYSTSKSYGLYPGRSQRKFSLRIIPLLNLHDTDPKRGHSSLSVRRRGYPQLRNLNTPTSYRRPMKRNPRGNQGN